MGGVFHGRAGQGDRPFGGLGEGRVVNNAHMPPSRAGSWAASLGPLVLADLRRRYAGSLLGGLWAWLGPLLEVAAYALLFGWLLGHQAGSGLRLAVLIAAGLLPWMALREALEGCASLLQDNRWIRRAHVPLELLVARQVLASSPRALVSLPLVALAVGASGPWPRPWDWLCPVAAVATQLVAAYGLGLGLAPLATLFPDLRPSLVSVLTLLTFASPIVYPETAVPAPLRWVLELNPFTHLLHLYRSPLVARDPSQALQALGLGGGVALAAVLAGRALARRLWSDARDRL